MTLSSCPYISGRCHSGWTALSLPEDVRRLYHSEDFHSFGVGTSYKYPIHSQSTIYLAPFKFSNVDDSQMQNANAKQQCSPPSVHSVPVQNDVIDLTS